MSRLSLQVIAAGISWDVTGEYYAASTGHSPRGDRQIGQDDPAVVGIDSICIAGNKTNLIDVLDSSVVSAIERKALELTDEHVH